jgi:hypothetical protein
LKQDKKKSKIKKEIQTNIYLTMKRVLKKVKREIMMVWIILVLDKENIKIKGDRNP